MAAPAPVPEEDEITNETLVSWFESALTTAEPGRRDSERYRDYYDGRQLTDAERTELRKRGQPEVIINRIKRKIDFLLGVETQQRTDPKAFPRNPEDEDSANAATDALRYVADNNDFDATRSAVWENMLVEGAGGCEVIAEMPRRAMMAQSAMTPPEPEIRIKHVAWDRLFWDVHSRKHDFSDARFLGYVIWMDFDAALSKFPKAKEVLEATRGGQNTDDLLEDKPDVSWMDSTKTRVRIVYIYYLDRRGVWQWCIFTKQGKIAGGRVPYQSDEGGNECPLIMQSAYIDRDNDRYGVVRELISPQDEINKRRSKALHLLTVNQIVADKGAVDDPEDARRQAARPDGYIEVAPNMRFEFRKDLPGLQGHFELLQQATNEIDLMGPNASMQGKGEQDQSGRAIIAQQQGGYIELGPLMDRLRSWTIRVYRSIWNRVKQFWKEQKWVRVTDNEDNVRFVGLNKPVTALDALRKQMEQAKAPPEQMQMALAQAAQDPRAQMVVGIENNLGEMDVDIIVEQAPDTVTIQQEQFDMLATAIPQLAQLPPTWAKLLIKASQLRNKDELVEMLEGGAEQDPQAQQMAQMQMQMQMEAARLELMKMQGEVHKLAADTDKSQAQAAQIEAEIGKPEAEPQPVDPLERMKLAADIRKSEASVGQTEATTFKTMLEALRPPEKPQNKAA